MINSYRDLVVWKKSKDLAVIVYRLSGKFPKEDLYGITSQIRRSAISIPSNIAEGRHRGTRKDFKQFLSIAYASGAELETQLEIAFELGRMTQAEYQEMTGQLDEVMRMLNAMIRKLKAES